jgi:excisionase family DNA binding protein
VKNKHNIKWYIITFNDYERSMIIMNGEIMSAEEVMEFLSVGKNTLYALLIRGEINAFKIGKVWKVPRKSIEEYIENKVRKN